MTKVSIIMPCYNEEKYIGRAIESLMDDYVSSRAELLVVDGGSSDRTVREVEKLIRKGYPIGLLENRRRLQCYGLNLGIKMAVGSIIVRVDAHSIYPKHYVKRLVKLLETTGAANVGGVMQPVGDRPVQAAVAQAMRHPVGVGDAKFHLGNYKGYVDTVYLGAFRKEIFERVGDYDTHCRTNEDAELNIRLQKAGEKIYLDSGIRVEYRPRDTFGKLALQYYRYGKGRAYTTFKHQRFTSYRQLAPPLLVLALLGSLGLAAVNPLFLLFMLSYVLAVIAAALGTWRERDIGFGQRLLMAIAFMTMHVSWGAGFLSYFFSSSKKQTEAETETTVEIKTETAEKPKKKTGNETGNKETGNNKTT